MGRRQVPLLQLEIRSNGAISRVLDLQSPGNLRTLWQGTQMASRLSRTRLVGKGGDFYVMVVDFLYLLSLLVLAILDSPPPREAEPCSMSLWLE